MRRTVILTVLWLVALPAAAQATFGWLPSAPLAEPGVDAYSPAVAMAPDGTIIALWTRGTELQTSTRPPGGVFSSPVRLSHEGPLATDEDVAVDGQGNAVAVWKETAGSSRRVLRAFRPAGGSFSEPVAMSPTDVTAGGPQIAVTPAGDAVVIWGESDGVTSRLGAAFRTAGGEFGEDKPFATDRSGANGFDVAIDGAGNALAIWSRETDDATSMVESAYAAAGGPFGDVRPVAGPAVHTADPHVGFDPSGNAVAAFLLWDPTITDTAKWRPSTTFRPAGGDFEPALPMSANNRVSEGPRVAMNPQGEAIVTFMQGFQPWGAVRPPGGAFATPVRLSPAAHDGFAPELGVDGTGRVQAVWLGNDGTGDKLHTVTRPAGGVFSEMQTVSDALSVTRFSQRVVADADGNAVAIWERTNQNDDRWVELAGYDGAPPRITDVTVPALAAPGASVAFGASVSDVWSPFSAAWEFGDGSGAPDAQASHAFAAPGTFTARVTATDALGNAASAERAIAVADTTAPSVSGLALAPKRFRAAPRGASVATRMGTTLRFSLSEPGSVVFRAQRATKGRRVGGKCRRATAKNRKRRPCTRFTAVRGSFAVKGTAGANQARFRGRLGGRKLRPGSYRLVAVASDAAGNASKPSRTPFRIVRR